MFKAVSPVNDINAINTSIDVILEPEVIDMQVALPKETLSDIFEAWIKYGIKMHTPNGRLITEWQITGYGRINTEFLRTRETGLNMAINMALRDIGAKIVLDFQKVPGVKNWLKEKIDCSNYSNLCQ